MKARLKQHLVGWSLGLSGVLSQPLAAEESLPSDITPVPTESTPTKVESTPVKPESTPAPMESAPVKPEPSPTKPETAPTKVEAPPLDGLNLREKIPDHVRQVRTTWDVLGRVSRKLTLQGQQILSEVRYEYDAAGRPILEVSREGETFTEIRRQFSSAGPTLVETFVNGTCTRRQRYEYGEAGLTRVELTDAAGKTQVTTYAYDLYSNPVYTETRGPEGVLQLVEQVEIPRPTVPITLGVSVGANLQTDVDLQELSAGFEIRRRPPIKKFGADPLEVGVAGSYRLSRSKGVLTNNQLLMNFGVDYHYLLPRTTFFVFTNLERNPIANLNVDLTLAPVGAKFQLAPNPPFTMDMSFAPVWNYRSVCTPSDSGVAGDCAIGQDTSTSYFRGSLRARAEYTLGPFTLSELLEYQPNLTPDTQPEVNEGQTVTPLSAALDTQSIFRNVLSLHIRLTSRLSVRQELRFVRDMSFRQQVSADECLAGTTNSTLCDGYALTSLTSLNLAFDVKR